MGIPRQSLDAAQQYLVEQDPVMGEAIELVGPCRLRVHKGRFHMLVRSIISQQISGKAARSIQQRVEALVDGTLTADKLAELQEVQLREAGVSPQKVGYLRDLAEKSLDGTVRLQRIGRLDDESVISELVGVKGIGRWTAQMFLMFSLGRLDVFPVDDLGVRRGIEKLYGLDPGQDHSAYEDVAAAWRPYASVASWYCWQILAVES